jgi:hypothetical protein
MKLPKINRRSRKAVVSGSLLFSHLLLLLVLCCGSCSDEVQPGSEPENPLQGSFESKFVRYQSGQKYMGKVSTTWTDTAWINDRIHRQLVLWAASGRLSNLTYEVSDLKGSSASIASSGIRLRFLQYVVGDALALDCGKQTARTPVNIADALSPIPPAQASDDPIKIWITIDIPPNTLPGKYTGSIAVKSDTSEQTFSVDILVANRTLPLVRDWSFHLDLWQFPFQLASISKVQPFSDDYFLLVEPFYMLLADAGQATITTYIKDGAFLPNQTMVKWTRNADDSWTFDYANFDKYVEKMMSWGIDKQISCFSLVGWNTPTGYQDVASGSYKKIDLIPGEPDFEAVWSIFLSSFKNHLNSKGWFSKAVIYMDEIPDAQMTKTIAVIKGNDPNWKIGVAGSHLSATNELALYDYSALLSSSRVTKSPVSTFYTSCSQTIPNNYVTPENNPAEMTWMAWHAAATGLNGYLRWAYDYWTKTDPLNIQDGSNSAGDFSMIYRANNALPNQALSSIRLELLREGIQDFEKIKILSDAQLNMEVRRFNAASGSLAAEMVGKGESLIKQLSVK